MRRASNGPKEGLREVDRSGPGFAARTIATEADVDDVIALLRLNYDRVVLRHGLPGERAA